MFSCCSLWEIRARRFCPRRCTTRLPVSLRHSQAAFKQSAHGPKLVQLSQMTYTVCGAIPGVFFQSRKPAFSRVSPVRSSFEFPHDAC
jgi:hypothetical protein